MFDQTSSNLPLLQSDSTIPLLFLFLSMPAWVSHFSPKRSVFSHRTVFPPQNSPENRSRRNFFLNSSIASASIPPSQPSDCPKAKEGRYFPTLGHISYQFGLVPLPRLLVTSQVACDIFLGLGDPELNLGPNIWDLPSMPPKSPKCDEQVHDCMTYAIWRHLQNEHEYIPSLAKWSHERKGPGTTKIWSSSIVRSSSA